MSVLIKEGESNSEKWIGRCMVVKVVLLVVKHVVVRCQYLLHWPGMRSVLHRTDDWVSFERKILGSWRSLWVFTAKNMQLSQYFNLYNNSCQSRGSKLFSWWKSVTQLEYELHIYATKWRLFRVNKTEWRHGSICKYTLKICHRSSVEWGNTLTWKNISQWSQSNTSGYV